MEYDKMKNEIKSGDIFEVNLTSNNIGFVQFISRDSSQMDSDVVAVFMRKLDRFQSYDISDITNSEVLMFLHSMVSVGEKLDVFKKIGNEPVASENTKPSFKCFNEEGSTGKLLSFLDRDEWEVWELNQDVKFVKNLGEHQANYDVGVIVPPREIANIIEAGKLTFLTNRIKKAGHP